VIATCSFPRVEATLRPMMHPEARDEGQDSPAPAQVAADVRAEGEEPERQGDEAHHLPEHRPRLIASDRRRVGGTQAWMGGYLLI
jgi:hypothetical protein